MKKFILIFGLCFGFITPTFAYSETYMCAQIPPAGTGKVANVVSNATGTNFLFTKVAELIIQRDLKKQLNSNFNVELYSFGGKNLIDGKFKAITVKSKKIASNDINVSNFSAKSLCDFNQIALMGNDIIYIENFLMDFETQITDADLKRTVLSKTYLDFINKIDVSFGAMTLFKVYDPTIAIVNNRIVMTIKTIIPSILSTKNLTVKIDAALGVEDEKIVFSDVNIGSSRNVNLAPILPMVNKLNPFVIKTKIDNNNAATVKIKDVKIKNNIITARGLVIIPKTPYVPKG